MNYPLISEYIDAIKSAEDNFDKLTRLRPVLDSSGTPVMSSGNFAVVFKMKDSVTGKFYAIKCFTKEQPGREESYKLIDEALESVSSPFLLHTKYYEKELYVDTKNSSETEFPIILMEWIEGDTLGAYIKENVNDTDEMGQLAYRFSQLSSWLVAQPFAHGDLKPDNILVKKSGSLVLVDYDGMYVPAMKGQKSRELGSPDFRHPLRTENDFDEHIDDFPIASILLSLKALSLKPSLYAKYAAPDRLLLSEKDARDVGGSACLKELSQISDKELRRLVRAFVDETKNLKLDTKSLILQAPPLRTECTEEDLLDQWKDRQGCIYCAGGKQLYKFPEGKSWWGYDVRKGNKGDM